MRIILCLIVYTLSALQPSVQKSTPSSPDYVAAVVEYSPITDTFEDSSQDIVSKNVANYVLYIRQASLQGADIIVFPEYGLVTLSSSINYSTHLPDPSDLVNPCTDDSIQVEEAIRTLSCEARNQSVYVVVNVPEVEPCDNATSCSDSGRLFYNSDVAFDRNGTIVARYRKYNLFGETGFSKTPEPELSVFDTDFGVKFGMFTCFDIQFEKPALSLVKELGITDIVFPTAWFSELPFLTAIQAQASWSHGLDVNFLAAGYNKPYSGQYSSGIYAGKEGPIVAIMPTVHTTQLLVATVPKKTKPILKNSSNVDFVTTKPYRNVFANRLYNNNPGIQMKRDFLEPYKTLLLTEEESFSEHTLCHDELCCDFQVVMHKDGLGQSSWAKGYVYRLAVFDGIRSYTYATGGVQICALISCTDKNLSSCGYELEGSEQENFGTVFDYIHISGNFRLNRSMQLPDMLVQGYSVLSSDAFQFTRDEIPDKNEVRVDMKTTCHVSNLLTFAIFGRDFLKDGGTITEPSVGQRINVAAGSIFLSIAVPLCLHRYF